jgi:hypothetical protein
MCFYLTATLPKKTKIEPLRQIFDEHNMSFSPLHNEFIESQLRPEEQYFRATKNYCDCDTILGSLNHDRKFQTLHKSKKVKALRKKKWSEEEINNWINDKLKSEANERGRKFTQNETNNETERWIRLLHKLLDNKIISRIGILKHWYSKGLEDEEISIKKTERIIIDEITSDFLLNLSEDVLYEFFPKYNY